MLTYSADEFFIPPGYKFCPTNEEILQYFLRSAINGEPLSSNIVVEAEIYGENKEPWKIFNKDASYSFWVFTELKKKSKKRIERVAGSGCWLGRCSKEIKNQSGKLLGFDKYFTFSCKKSISQNNGSWVMHEYSLCDEGLEDYVICKIENKDVVMDQVESSNHNRNRKRKTVEVSSDDQERSSSVQLIAKKVCGDRGQSNSNWVQISSTTSNPNIIDEQNFGKLLDHQVYGGDPNRDYISALEAYLDDDDDLPKGFDEFSSFKKSDLQDVVNVQEMSNIPSLKEVCVENNQNQATGDIVHHPTMLLQPMMNISHIVSVTDQANVNQSPRQQHFATDDSFCPGPEALPPEYEASIEENKDQRLGQPAADYAEDSFYNDLDELKCDAKALTLNDLNNKDFLTEGTDFYLYYQQEQAYNYGLSLDELF